MIAWIIAISAFPFSSFCQLTDTIELVPRKGNSIFLKEGDTLDLEFNHSSDRTYRHTAINKGVIRAITSDSIYMTSASVSVIIYDSARFLETRLRGLPLPDSSQSFGEPPVTGIALSSIRSISIRTGRKDHLMIVEIGAFLGFAGSFSYLLAPPFAKTTSAGALNPAVYYGMAAGGVAAMAVGLYSFSYIFFHESGLQRFTIYQARPAKIRKHGAYLKVY